MLGRESLVNSFSILKFLSHPDILKNVGAQVLGYSFGVLTNQPIDPIKFLPSIINYSPQTILTSDPKMGRFEFKDEIIKLEI